MLALLTEAHIRLNLECAYINNRLAAFMSKRTHIVIPEQLVQEIDTLVGKRGRSGFLTEAAWKEVRRLRMLRGLEEASGSWKDKDHPELRGGSGRYVEKTRKEADKRFALVTKR